MTKLEWCRANCPDALRNVSDEMLLDMMSSSYDKFCAEKEPDAEPESLNETNNYLDEMVKILATTFGDNLAFKGGYMLTKMIPEVARQTADIDFSIQSSSIYADLIEAMKNIGELFIKKGYIERYTIKDTVAPGRSGGMDMYDSSGKKVLGIDVGWHNLTYGTTTTNIRICDVRAFTVERMLADKIRATLTRRRFRRSKDIYDIYCITNCMDFNAKVLYNYLYRSDDPEWDNFPFSEEINIEFEKAYSKLKLVSIVKDKALEKPAYQNVLERFNVICYKLLDMDSNCFWCHDDCSFH